LELTNEFKVDVPIESAWAILTDLERIAPCLPGAELREVEGDEYRGVVKVKVGPIATTYEGKARFVELDTATRRVQLKAEGRETRGQGNANALVTATMAPSGSGTSVTVVTDLAISGKVAQFGRGVLADVSSKLLEQFVVNLESTVLSSDGTDSASAEDGAVAAPSTPRGAEPSAGDADPSSGVREIHSAPAEPVDVVALAGGSVARRALPIVVIALILAVGIWAMRRR